MHQPISLPLCSTTPPPAITAQSNCSFAALCNGAVLKCVFCGPHRGGKTRFERTLFLFLCVVTRCSKIARNKFKARAVLRNVFLTCRWRFGVDGGRGGDEGREEEGSKRSFGVEGGALCGQILTAAHAAVDLKIQGLGFLLEGSAKKMTRKEMKITLFFNSLITTSWVNTHGVFVQLTKCPASSGVLFQDIFCFNLMLMTSRYQTKFHCLAQSFLGTASVSRQCSCSAACWRMINERRKGLPIILHSFPQRRAPHQRHCWHVYSSVTAESLKLLSALSCRSERWAKPPKHKNLAVMQFKVIMSWLLTHYHFWV